MTFLSFLSFLSFVPFARDARRIRRARERSGAASMARSIDAAPAIEWIFSLGNFETTALRRAPLRGLGPTLPGAKYHFATMP
jgi:hypothetical protein